MPQVQQVDEFSSISRVVAADEDVSGVVDEAVDGGRVGAALGAHDVGRLAGVGREHDQAVAAVGHVPSEGGLARAGKAEDAEDFPSGFLRHLLDGHQRIVLLGRPLK